ncbi:hypothetical protein GmHk_02G003052 [Glycine max]|nr:hypothetical protein GmHk_02G003052 [Glycine max]
MNAKRKKIMIGVFPNRRILMRGIGIWQRTPPHPDHNIWSMAQDMAQALSVGEHLHRMMGSDNYSPN